MFAHFKTLATGVIMVAMLLGSLNIAWGIPTAMFNEEFFVGYLVSADEETRFKALSLPGIESRIYAAKAYVLIYKDMLEPLAPQRALHYMADALNTMDIRIRVSFAIALGEIGRPNDRILGGLLNDGVKDRHQHPIVRRASWEALQKLLPGNKFHQFVVRHLVMKKPLYQY